MLFAICIGLLPDLFPSNAVVRPAAVYTYARLREDLTRLKREFPTELDVDVIGYSREGRAIYAARAGRKDAPVRVLIQAGIHAREHMTGLLVMAQLERLLRRGIPDWAAFYMLPMANPDGVAMSQTGLAGQKAIEIYAADRAAGYADCDYAQYLKEWKANAAGVDLNRNFDAGWDLVDTRPGPSTANYRGFAPESEPETQALAAYTLLIRPDVTLSYHAMGEEIFYDFGCNAPVNEAGLSLARIVARRTGYRLVPDDQSSFGGYKDWAIEKLSIPSLTIEIGHVKTPLPISEFPDIWRKNRDVPMIAAKWARSAAAPRDNNEQ